MKRASVLIAIGVAMAMVLAAAVVSYSAHDPTGDAADSSSGAWLDTAVVPLSVNSQLSLSGQVDPNAPSGVAILQVDEGADEVNYQVWVANVASPSEVTIESGSGTAVQLYPTDRGSIDDTSGTFTGLLARGAFTASDLVGPMQGQSIPDFVAALKGGQLNVNVPATSGTVSGQVTADTVWENAKLVTLLPAQLTSNAISRALDRLGVDSPLQSPIVVNEILANLEGKNLGSAIWGVPWGGAIISNENGALHYGLWAFNLAGSTEVTLNKGGVELSGPSVASLFSGDVGSASGSTVRGLVAEGTLTESDLVGPLQGQSISDLVSVIDSGDIIITLDPAQNDVGELRAQPYTL